MTYQDVFLKSTAFTILFAGFSETGYASFIRQGGKNKRRITLAEPGPMLPPVPAILLTVNGKNENPDEISVVWTFIIEGDPPQIGISVHEHHIARELVSYFYHKQQPITIAWV